MTLPITIASDIGRPGHHPPIKTSGGSFYALIREPVSDYFSIYKADSDDPTSGWTEVDSGNRPSTVFVLGAWVLDGDIIHIAAVGGGASPGYEYLQFNTSTDLWVTGAFAEIDAVTDQPDQFWISIAVRSDGDVVVAYAGVTDAEMGNDKERVDVNIRTSGTWGGPVALDAGGDKHYGNPNCVLGTNDFVHCVWQRTDSPLNDPPVSWDIIEGRSVDPSDDSLSTTELTSEGAGTNPLIGIPNIVTYDDSGTQRIGISGFASILELDTTLATEVSNDIDLAADGIHEAISPQVRITNEFVRTTFAALDVDIHCFYSGGGAAGVDLDLYYMTSTDDGNSWSAPTEELDGVTVNFISADIYAKGTPADTGWKFPGTMVGNRTLSGSDADWSNADNCKLDNGSQATAVLTGSQTTSGLAATNFDFSSIPAGSIITGVEIRLGDYDVQPSNSGGPSIANCRLILADDSDGSINRGGGGTGEILAPFTGLRTDEAPDAGANLWSESLTRVDVQDPDFGFFVGARLLSTTTTFGVDFMQMRVFYTPPPVVLAYVYDDGGVQKYNEKILIAGGFSASGTPDIAKPTSAGTVLFERDAAGTPSVAKPTSSGAGTVTGLGPIITDVNGTESWDDGDTGLVITGIRFL